MRCTRCSTGLALALAVLLAHRPAAAQDGTGDPFEPFNRAVFAFNQTLDGLILEPFAIMYRGAIPSPVRRGVNNVLQNLRTPVVLANDLFQGEWQRAEVTFGRFMINTVVGVAGIFDIATWAGMEASHDEDFGQTLAVYGVDSGPYLMLPLLGPSSPRDAVGRVVDAFLDPFSILFSEAIPLEYRLLRSGMEVLTFREQNLESVNELKRSSLDFYAATRTLTRQFRESAIRNGRPAPLEDIYDESIYEDLEDPAADPAGALEDPEESRDAP